MNLFDGAISEAKIGVKCDRANSRGRTAKSFIHRNAITKVKFFDGICFLQSQIDKTIHNRQPIENHKN